MYVVENMLTMPMVEYVGLGEIIKDVGIYIYTANPVY